MTVLYRHEQSDFQAESQKKELKQAWLDLVKDFQIVLAKKTLSQLDREN